MKRILTTLLIAAASAITMQAKTTYVPAYVSYIHIAHQGDTISKANNLRSLELTAQDGTFRITIQHEDLTGDRVKAIKRMKAAAGWAMVSAATQGVSTAFSQNALQYVVRRGMAQTATALAAIYAGLAQAEQTLDVEVWLENTSDEELMVNDQERGRTWFVQPRQTLLLSTANPDLLRLRVSDLQHRRVSFATIAAGSAVDKAELKYEDADCWVITAYERKPDGTLSPLGGYQHISKHDFASRLMNHKQLQQFLADRQK